MKKTKAVVRFVNIRETNAVFRFEPTSTLVVAATRRRPSSSTNSTPIVIGDSDEDNLSGNVKVNISKIRVEFRCQWVLTHLARNSTLQYNNKSVGILICLA